MNKAIATLAPLFYLPRETPAFHDFMWTEQRASIMMAPKTTTPVMAPKTATPVMILKKRLPPSFISVVAGRAFETVSEEMDERQKMALYFHASKARRLQLKEAGHRLTYADIDSILSDLMTIPRQEGWTSCFGYGWVDLPLCIACAQYYHSDIVVGDAEHKTFVRFLGSESGRDIVSFLLDKSKRRLVPTDHVPTEAWFELWDYRKPLRAISHYKIEELNDIVHKLPYVGALSKKSTKQELYTAIEHYCFGLTRPTFEKETV